MCASPSAVWDYRGCRFTYKLAHFARRRRLLAVRGSGGGKNPSMPRNSRISKVIMPLVLTTAMAAMAESDKRRSKMAVLMVGFANRSIQTTAPPFRQHILEPARSYGYDVDVFVYSFYWDVGLEGDASRGDNVRQEVQGNAPVNQFAAVEHMLGAKVVKTFNQDSMTSLNHLNHSEEGFSIRGATLRSMLRDMYQEAAGIDIVPMDEYDLLFMVGPDMYFASNLTETDLLAALEPGVLVSEYSPPGEYSETNGLLVENYTPPGEHSTSGTYAFGGFSNKLYLGTPQTVSKIARRLADAANGLDKLTTPEAWIEALRVLRGPGDGKPPLYPPHERPNWWGSWGRDVLGRPLNSERICLRYSNLYHFRPKGTSLLWTKLRTSGQISPTHIYTLQKTARGRELIQRFVGGISKVLQNSDGPRAPSLVTFQKDNNNIAIHIGYHASIVGSLNRVTLIDHNSSQATQTYIACCQREGLQVVRHTGPFSEKHTSMKHAIKRVIDDSSFVLYIDGDEFLLSVGVENGTSKQIAKSLRADPVAVRAAIDHLPHLTKKYKTPTFTNICPGPIKFRGWQHGPSMPNYIATEFTSLTMAENAKKGKAWGKVIYGGGPNNGFLDVGQGDEYGKVIWDKNVKRVDQYAFAPRIGLLHLNQKSLEAQAQKLERAATAYGFTTEICWQNPNCKPDGSCSGFPGRHYCEFLLQKDLGTFATNVREQCEEKKRESVFQPTLSQWAKDNARKMPCAHCAELAGLKPFIVV